MDSSRQPSTPTENAPSRVQSVVAARLALLSEDARAAAEVAAAVGRDFRFDILAKASDLEEDALVRALDELWRRHIVRVQADERWDFTHDRIREVTYAGIGPARRRLIHRRIAQGMELLFASRLDEVSASIAMHLDRGGQASRAVPYLERAAAVATRVSASEEAIRCLSYALALAEQLPPGRDRGQLELRLRSSLSVALNSARGYAAPEVEENLERVFELLRSDSPGRVPVRWLWVAFTMRFMLGDMKGTREVCEQALERSLEDPSCRCEAHHAMGGVLLGMGELEASRQHFEAALDAYDETYPQRSALGSDLGVFAHAWFSHAMWLLGDERTALRHAEDGIALAERLTHPYSQTIALAYAALLHQMRRDAVRVLDCAERAVALCDKYAFAYYGEWAKALIGWAHGQKRPVEGIAEIEAALGELDAKRAQARRPYYLSLLAETCALAGNRNRAASILDAAINMARDRIDVWWLPALYLQKSGLEPASAREAMRQLALDTARSQGSRGLEQRILTAESQKSL
jgi:tetratricopeptide (TPR) repeat protein